MADYNIPDILPSSVTSGVHGSHVVNTIEESLGYKISKSMNYERMIDILVRSPNNAIASGDQRAPITHEELYNFVKDFPIGDYGFGRNSRVGVVLPEGPELGLCVLSVMAHCTVVPINNDEPHDEIVKEFTKMNVQACILDASLSSMEIIQFLTEANIKIFFIQVDLQIAGKFSLTPSPNQLFDAPVSESNKYSCKNDYGLILRTSGTSGNKKTVPYRIHTLLVGAKCVADSWALRSVDVNLNMMPLYHIGGICRNLLAPLINGGSAILTKGFDPALFWDIIETHRNKPTWYYAVPTMHLAILDEGGLRYGDDVIPPTQIRMVCNAGGGLQDSLAREIREYFNQCVVLPSYGMTECMPISTPLQSYALDIPSTSGISCGPIIAIYNDKNERLPTMRIGNICVKGEPCFEEYENNASANESSFNQDGFFNTGDVGYLDANGYLFITGRSKEVINRGGEIIAPVDVESAVMKHPRVANCMAFSVAHDVLQEVVGIVIVPQANGTRIDLQELHRFLRPHLHPSKWPQVIVYMDNVPRNMNNKALRINFANRCGLVELTDAVSPSGRLYEAKAPPKTASLKDPIPASLVRVNSNRVVETILKHPDVIDAVAMFGLNPNDEHALTAFIAISTDKFDSFSPELMDAWLVERCHDYDRPKSIYVMQKIPRNSDGLIDYPALEAHVRATRSSDDDMTPLERAIADIFTEVIGYRDQLTKDSDFFEIGGDSLKAGRVVYLIRKRFEVSITAMTLFSARKVEILADLVAEHLPEDSPYLRDDFDSFETNSTLVDVENERQPSSAKNPSRFWALFIQSLPIFIIRPIRIVLRWTIFAHVLIYTNAHFPAFYAPGSNPVLRTVQLCIAVFFSTLFIWLGLPLVSIVFKWLIIGRYKAGGYPLWGRYYLRWWIVDQINHLCGRGLFAWTSSGLILYLKLMGAKVGRSCEIDARSNFGEFDLLDIGNNVEFENARIRSFTMQTGRMVLGPIKIGENTVVNTKTVIAPGAYVPAGTVFPPLSSSYELRDSNEEFRYISRARVANPNVLLKIFVGFPILLIIYCAGMFPWVVVIWAMTRQFYFYEYMIPTLMGQVLFYFGSIHRILWHALAVVCRDTVSPFIRLAVAIIIKWTIVGRFKANSDKELTQWDKFEHWLMYTIFGDGTLCGTYRLLGSHYEATSVIYRLLGAKIGKHIYWPGTGLSFYEFDLITVEDDVVFGSRSILTCSDLKQQAPIKIEAGAMVADRCVLLPGTVIGRNAILGSGGLSRANTTYPAGSIWIGSQGGGALLWDLGNREEALNSPTITPFAKAFYERKANFFVLPLWLCITYCIVWNCICSIFFILPIITGVQIAKLTYPRGLPLIAHSSTMNFVVFLVMLASISAAFAICTYLALLVNYIAKWSLFGRRKEGKYNWDESSYCQKWQVYLCISHISYDYLELLRGTHYIVMFFRALGSSIGQRVCLYPTGGDPMMTEPELINIGDDVAIDEASIVAHINSKGQFSLNALKIGSGSVLRSGSRLLSGAEMDNDSVLLEHTLIISGDVVESGSVWQGWPAQDVSEQFCPDRTSHISTNRTRARSSLHHSVKRSQSVLSHKKSIASYSQKSYAEKGISRKQSVNSYRSNRSARSHRSRKTAEETFYGVFKRN